MAGVSCPQLARCHTPAPIWSLQFIRAHGQHSIHSIHITLSHQHHRSYRHRLELRIKIAKYTKFPRSPSDTACSISRLVTKPHLANIKCQVTASKSSQDPKCDDYQGFRSTKKCWCGDCGGLEWLDWTISVIWCQAGESLVYSSRDV